MPWSYILLHLAVSGAAFIGTLLLLYERSWRRWVIGPLALLVVGGGLLLESRPEVAIRVIPTTDAVFLTNWSLAGAVVLLALLWNQARGRSARLRAALITPVALGVSLWSYAWLFRPPPAPLFGEIGWDGACLQTSVDSCSPAAAVTLLAWHDIETNEAEMADLSLTRDKHGTSPLGMYRGVAIQARRHGLRAHVVHLDHWVMLNKLGSPAIVSVGLPRNAPPAVQAELARGGWQPGVRHAVVVVEIDTANDRVLVADPAVGVEWWSTAELEQLWNHRALVLTPR